jgi:hypothetical protein
MTVFVNLFQNLGSGYMKLLPEFQIESISASEKKARRYNKLVSKSVFKPGAFPLSNFGTRQQTILNYVT